MIEKITDQNLERYDSRLKEWCDKKFFEKGNYGKYETTEEAGAVAFYPVGNSLLAGTVKFSFEEILPVSGDKSPTNPSTIAGVSSVNVNVCEWNILKYESFNQVTGDLTSTDNNDGTFTLNGVSPSGGKIIYRDSAANESYASLVNLGKPIYRTYLPEGTYKFGVLKESGIFTANNGACYMRINASSVKKLSQLIASNYTSGNTSVYDIASMKSSYLSDTISGTSFAVPEGGCYYSWCVVSSSTTSYTNCVIRPYLYKVGSDISGNPIITRNISNLSLGNTYYGGEIDLATGVMTVTQFGEEFGVISSSKIFVGSIQTNTVAFDIICENRNKGNTSQGIHVSNRFEFEQSNNDYEHFRATGDTSTGSLSLRFFINKSRLDLSIATDQSNPTNSEWIQAFLAWLTNNHIFVVCDLFSPQTITLTSTEILSLTQTDKYTPRLNTVYTDADSVQISYLKSPIRDEYEKTQAILSLGGNS